jgi:signal transduction histidine kinase
MRTAAAANQIEMLHKIPPRASDPNAVIADLEKLLRGVVGEKVSFRANLDPQLGHVASDPTTLGWVLVNLTVNALKAMLARNVVITTSNVELDPGAASDVNLSPGSYIRIELDVSGNGVDDQPAIWNLVQEARGAVAVRDAGAEGVMVTVLLPRMPVVESPDHERPGGAG